MIINLAFFKGRWVGEALASLFRATQVAPTPEGEFKRIIQPIQ
jgi:hypothetical protein